jgi:heat shock protein HtpX
MLTVGSIFSQPASTKLILRTYRARRINSAESPELMALFDAVCQRADLNRLPLYYVPTRLPNAFAAGTGKQSLVAVSDGLLRMMNARELAGVLAHEVAHVKNNDIQVMGLADAIARTTSFLARLGMFTMLLSFSGSMMGMSFGRFAAAGLVLFFAPTVLILLQLAISRTREFDADVGAAEITGDPMGLAQALQKLESKQKRGILERIFSPGPSRSQPAMLRTHPETGERVERLAELARLQAKREAVDAIVLPADNPAQPVSVGPPKVRRRARYHVSNGMWY